MSERWNGESRIALGDAVLLLAMLMWLSIGVGPWWLGVVLFVVAGILNYASQRWLRP